MKKINLAVRFSKNNVTFWIRFAIAIVVPVLSYMGLELTDMTTWGAVLDVIKSALGNPYVLGLAVINIINLLPDPTTQGLWDSEQALTYKTPKTKD